MVTNQIKLIPLLIFPLALSSTTGTKTKSKSGANDMAAKIAKDVQSQLSKQGINIPLPFG